MHKLIDIVYVPIKNADEIINCYFTNNLQLADRAYISRPKDRSVKLEKLATRQCCFCDKYIENFSKFKTHINCCFKTAGVVYKFENKSIINFQDNFKYMDDLPFDIYFDCETTTGETTTKMFLISYCQTYAIHPNLNSDRVLIFHSFQQSAEEIFDLNYFSESHAKYFDQVTFEELKDAATNV